jgi:catechol 2,3-dioxygenase-like lactoylglutathione lyase family enzyme
MTTTLTDTVKFHLSLNVADLAVSLAFYEVMFGQPAAKSRPDYAKFELEEPPVVLSLVPSGQVPSGRLNHAGIRLASAEALVEMQMRLEQAGVRTQREEGVECCYARQTKFWVTDPDRTLWEMYIVHEDIEEHGSGSIPTALPQQVPAALPMANRPASLPMASAAPQVVSPGATDQPAIYQHILMVPLPERIPHADGTLDIVRLEGTTNARHTPAALAAFLADAHRALRPGGQVVVHGLVTSRSVEPGSFQLPGMAAVVEQVPLEHETQEMLNAAGFAEVQFTKLGDKPCFVVGDAEMREMLLTGRKPNEGACINSVVVIYKGPFAELKDDEGHVFPRGHRVAICSRTAGVLLRSPAASQFTFLAGGGPAVSCGK